MSMWEFTKILVTQKDRIGGLYTILIEEKRGRKSKITFRKNKWGFRTIGERSDSFVTV